MTSAGRESSSPVDDGIIGKAVAAILCVSPPLQFFFYFLIFSSNKIYKNALEIITFSPLPPTPSTERDINLARHLVDLIESCKEMSKLMIEQNLVTLY